MKTIDPTLHRTEFRRTESPYLEGISVVMPCLNEEKTIGRCIEIALQTLRDSRYSGEVIVSDNGSQDHSVERARAAGARVISVSTRGYGAALNAGILAAQYRWVVFADADLSYPFDQILDLIEPLMSDKADFVLGTRLRGDIAPGAMPFLNRYAGTPVLSFLIRTFFKLPTSDCNSGMRALKRELYERLGLLCPGMEYASEMLIRAKGIDLRCVEVPIRFGKDGRDTAPHLRPWRDGWRHLRFILTHISSKLMVAFPLCMSAVLLIVSFALSLQGFFFPTKPTLYHTALVSIALSVPPILIALSVLLIKIALPSSCHGKELALIQRVKRMGDRSVPILIALFFMGLTFAEILFLFFQWKKANWGALNEIGAVIRIMIFTVVATGFFVLDIGLGILGLIPQSNENRRQFTH